MQVSALKTIPVQKTATYTVLYFMIFRKEITLYLYIVKLLRTFIATDVSECYANKSIALSHLQVTSQLRP